MSSQCQPVVTGGWLVPDSGQPPALRGRRASPGSWRARQHQVAATTSTVIGTSSS